MAKRTRDSSSSSGGRDWLGRERKPEKPSVPLTPEPVARPTPEPKAQTEPTPPKPDPEPVPEIITAPDEIITAQEILRDPHNALGGNYEAERNYVLVPLGQVARRVKTGARVEIAEVIGRADEKFALISRSKHA